MDLALVKIHRQKLSLTQQQLAARANISLATLQNIEAGAANPCLAVLNQIFEALGLELSLNPRRANWKYLITAGVPLVETKGHAFRFVHDRLQLINQIKLAVGELIQIPDERKADALQAFLLAMKNHYPSFWKQVKTQNPEVSAIMPIAISGRLIKLCRIALSRINYL